MEKNVLKAQHRPQGKTTKAIRREGLLPAVMYGRHYPSTPIVLNAHEASLIIPRLSSSAIVTIDLDGDPQATLIREKQKDYVRNALIHVDFQVVSMTEKLRTSVRVDLTGTAPAVKDFNGVVFQNMNEITVECLPKDLPERITLDISGLKNLSDAIHVSDLNLSQDIAVLHDPDEVIVIISATREEPEEEAVSGQELLEPEVIERGKKEEDEDND